MSNVDKIHREALTQIIVNALEFNAVTVAYATQILNSTGGAAVKPHTAKRISSEFKRIMKAYQDRFDEIAKDIDEKAGIKNG